MINLHDLSELNSELDDAIMNLSAYHSDMDQYPRFYKNSAFYARRPGDNAASSDVKSNYLKILGDKNIHYTSEMPDFNVVGTPEDRENANIREKILYAVHRASGTPQLQKMWSRDATLKSIAIAETIFDRKLRRMVVRRYDPRYVYWQVSNQNEMRVTAFWAVFPITKAEAKRRYGVEPNFDYRPRFMANEMDSYLGIIDGQEWFTEVIRWDDQTRTAWIGDQFIEKPHDHRMGEIPVDLCAPFPSDERNRLGDFYLEQLVPMQAKLNDLLRRQDNIIRRMSNPIVYAKGLQTRSFDDVKSALRNADSGLLGIGKDGDLGILQLQETAMLDNAIEATKNDMQRLSGFGSASFGETVGANTSGDALGMYFQPTQKHIDDQNISWINFYESINAKILRGYDTFGRTGETFSLNSLAPRSTVMGSQGDFVNKKGGGEVIKFTNKAINGNYINRVLPKSVTPKNEIEEKRLIVEAVQQKFLSRTTGYEKWGLESPEDEKALLIIEQSEPMLNPDGISKILQAQPQAPAAPQMPGSVTPASPELTAGVPNGA